ncbi:MAG: NADH-quinone oxidoreductase subunit N, partial [Candidatus Tectomicrobia bacterium]|nr:NADH-quinone oxidoreductase subunit N [Candidatus Tectomicrobia bacterium]
MEIAIPSLSWVDFLRIGPVLILSLFGMLVLLWDAVIRPHGPKEHLAYLSLTGVILALLLCLRLLGEDLYGTSFGDMLVLDRYALFFYLVFLLGTGLTLLLSVDYLRREGVAYGEYYALVLFTTVGMMLMASGLDLILIFLGLEILSLSLYILSGYIRTDHRGGES